MVKTRKGFWQQILLRNIVYRKNSVQNIYYAYVLCRIFSNVSHADPLQQKVRVFLEAREEAGVPTVTAGQLDALAATAVLGEGIPEKYTGPPWRQRHYQGLNEILECSMKAQV